MPILGKETSIYPPDFLHPTFWSGADWVNEECSQSFRRLHDAHRQQCAPQANEVDTEKPFDESSLPDRAPSELAADPERHEQRKWWAVFTRSRQEKALARELLSYDVPFYLPLVKKETPTKRRILRSYVPIFGNYLFVYGNEDERIRALTTNRVSRMLEVTDQAQLCYDLMQLNHLIEMDAPLTIERRIEQGQLVRIKSGPMRGVEGTVTQRRGRRRLLVAVHFLQNGVSVEIDDFMVEPL